MALMYFGIAILSLIGAGAVAFWTRKSDEGWTTGVLIMVAALVILGIAMFALGLSTG